MCDFSNNFNGVFGKIKPGMRRLSVNGNICNPVIDLIEYRYDRQLTTFVTTNLAPEEFKDKYDVRIADRFNEMIHKIVFQDENYRK